MIIKELIEFLFLAGFISGIIIETLIFGLIYLIIKIKGRKGKRYK